MGATASTPGLSVRHAYLISRRSPKRAQGFINKCAHPARRERCRTNDAKLSNDVALLRGETIWRAGVRRALIVANDYDRTLTRSVSLRR